MKKILKEILSSFRGLTKFEWLLWGVSVGFVLLSGFLSPNGILSCITSLIGVTALIFVARGDVLGQFLCVFFAVLYGIISLSYRYYGEAITYLGMSAPSAVVALISWLRNPYSKKEVRISRLRARALFHLIPAAIAVTAIFYYLLRALSTENLALSTISITTSFLASYLTFRRSPLYALAYAANDIVLIALWILATLENPAYLSMIFCFFMFLANDIYGYINWTRMYKKQRGM